MFIKCCFVLLAAAAVVLANGDKDHLLGQYKFLIIKSCGDCGRLVQRKCYKLVDYMEANWHGANIHCNSIGMRLATIDNKEQQEEVERLIPDSSCGKKGVWIGASNLADKKEWVWTPTGECLGYNNWAPSCKRTERCVEQLLNKRGWNDKNCDLKQNFVCESVSQTGCVCKKRVPSKKC